MRKIKVKFEMDRCGCLLMTPVNERLQGRIKRYLAEWKVGWDGSVLVQEDYNADAAMERHLTRSQQREVNEGWPVVALVDPWEWLHYVGWDAHEGVAVP